MPERGGTRSGRARDWEAFEEDDPEEHMPVPDQTRNGAEFCLRVRGDSMDEVFPEGTLLFCRPFYEEDHALPIDKYVIAVTSSAHTDQIEATVKRLCATITASWCYARKAAIRYCMVETWPWAPTPNSGPRCELARLLWVTRASSTDSPTVPDISVGNLLTVLVGSRTFMDIVFRG